MPIHAPVGARYDGGRWSEAAPRLPASIPRIARGRSAKRSGRCHIARRISGDGVHCPFGLSRLQAPGGDSARPRGGASGVVSSAKDRWRPAALESSSNDLSRAVRLVHFVEHESGRS